MVTANSLITVDRCRCCGSAALHEVLDLGATPLADRLLHEPGQQVPLYPLHVLLCTECGLVQLAETVAPHLLFDDDYPYLSSTSTSWLAHCQQHAQALIGRLGLDQNSLVVELASNDGYMLNNFHSAGIPVLGFEPSRPAYEASRGAGIPTENTFFDLQGAREMRDRGQKADLVIANNVLAHVPEPLQFLHAIGHILKDTGTLSIEAAYLPDMVQQCAFDTIYHQHICYFSLSALHNLLTRAGLVIGAVERVPTQGGSLRVLAGKRLKQGADVTRLLEQESRAQVTCPEYFVSFRDRIENLRRHLPEVLAQHRSQGRTLAGYGAAAKGTTLLSYCGGAQYLDYLVDANEYKTGRYFPVGALPIHSLEHLRQNPPDVLLLLAWNLEAEIREQQHEFLQHGGEIIVPIPPERVSDRDQ